MEANQPSSVETDALAEDNYADDGDEQLLPRLIGLAAIVLLAGTAVIAFITTDPSNTGAAGTGTGNIPRATVRDRLEIMVASGSTVIFLVITGSAVYSRARADGITRLLLLVPSLVGAGYGVLKAWLSLSQGSQSRFFMPIAYNRLATLQTVLFGLLGAGIAWWLMSRTPAEAGSPAEPEVLELEGPAER